MPGPSGRKEKRREESERKEDARFSRLFSEPQRHGHRGRAVTVVPRRVHTRRGARAGRDYPFAHAKPPQGCPRRRSAPYLLAPPKFRIKWRRTRSSDSTQTKGPAKASHPDAGAIAGATRAPSPSEAESPQCGGDRRGDTPLSQARPSHPNAGAIAGAPLHLQPRPRFLENEECPHSAHPSPRVREHAIPPRVFAGAIGTPGILRIAE
jgi:hypothetical protein